MSERHPKLLIADMIECSNAIIHYTQNMSYYDFVENNLVKDAVMRNFGIMGEAANRLPQELKEKYPAIDWRRIRGFRNRIVHDYFGIDYRIIWLVIESFLPNLLSKLQQLDV